MIVDRLAKLALITGIMDQEDINSDFPFEQLRLYVGGKKITGSIKQLSRITGHMVSHASSITIRS